MNSFTFGEFGSLKLDDPFSSDLTEKEENYKDYNELTHQNLMKQVHLNCPALTSKKTKIYTNKLYHQNMKPGGDTDSDIE